MRSIEDLLESFTSATEEGRLVWEAGGNQRYVAQLPRHQVVVWQWVDENDGTEGVTARLERKDGAVLDAVSASAYNLKFAILGKLYTAARRSAHDVNSVIDEVERELASLRPVRA